ncbi:RING finger protein 141-like [Acanthaster planci]|uniref:RING finger protein 141 n=1 Tax=Acanthaster planci TaxID=133434 RepID=A0A8B7Y582_ACAPL|nr:RING finger protein 141-like [Acanthaster planci]XP_022088359.1 RING finger protein 141-like [Acanthaster planci]
MGHSHSSGANKHGSLWEWRDFVFSQGHLLKQLATLKYADFVQAVDSLNTISNTLSSSKGRYLIFSIIPGTDCTTILWKSRVRIQCCKMMYGDDKCESTRTMTLRQFVQVYDSIMQQCQSIEDRLNTSEACKDAASGGGNDDAARCTCGLDRAPEEEASGAEGREELGELEEDDQPQSRTPGGWLEVSTIFATVEQVSLESIDEGDCCICMEKKADIVLSCTHTYCQLCIEDWRKQHNTCPMCMDDMGNAKDLWALPDKPDADEMTAYLMSIADSKEQRRGGNPQASRQQVEEWEAVSFD